MRKVYQNKRNLGTTSQNDQEFWSKLSPIKSGVVANFIVTPTTAGVSYAANEVLTVSVGGGNAQAKVLTVGTNKGVLTLQVAPVAVGQGYYSGTGFATTASLKGSGCTVALNTITEATTNEHAAATLKANGYIGSFTGMLAKWIKSNSALT